MTVGRSAPGTFGGADDLGRSDQRDQDRGQRHPGDRRGGSGGTTNARRDFLHHHAHAARSVEDDAVEILVHCDALPGYVACVQRITQASDQSIHGNAPGNARDSRFPGRLILGVARRWRAELLHGLPPHSHAASQPPQAPTERSDSEVRVK